MLGILVATNNLIPFLLLMFFMKLTLSSILIIHYSLKNELNLLLIKLGSAVVFCLIFLHGGLLTHFFIDKNYSNHLSLKW